jgi:hypothetical protein
VRLVVVGHILTLSAWRFHRTETDQNVSHLPVVGVMLHRQVKSSEAIFIPVVNLENRFPEEELKFGLAQTATGCQGKGGVAPWASVLQRVRKILRLLRLHMLEPLQPLLLGEPFVTQQEHDCVVVVAVLVVDGCPRANSLSSAFPLQVSDRMSQLLLQTFHLGGCVGSGGKECNE